MCVTTTDMREGFCEVSECNKKCNSNCGSEDSKMVLLDTDSKEICSNNNAKNCDRNNNDVISLKQRRNNYVLG